MALAPRLSIFSEDFNWYSPDSHTATVLQLSNSVFGCDDLSLSIDSSYVFLSRSLLFAQKLLLHDCL